MTSTIFQDRQRLKEIEENEAERAEFAARLTEATKKKTASEERAEVVDITARIAAREKELRAQVKETAAELESLYEAAITKAEALVTAIEQIAGTDNLGHTPASLGARSRYEAVRSAAQSEFGEYVPAVPKFSERASRDHAMRVLRDRLVAAIGGNW